MRDIFEPIITVIMIALLIVATVAITRVSILDKVAIVHSGAIVITEVSVTDHDSGSMCSYTDRLMDLRVTDEVPAKDN